MSIPATDKIVATAATKHITHSFDVSRFKGALRSLEIGQQMGKIYNMEFENAKYWIAQGTEHAQHIAAEKARTDKVYSDADPRGDIGYAFCMNQAASLARRLRKLDSKLITPGIQSYLETLDQIAAVYIWLKSFKPIIVKGRKPNPNAPPPDLTNMATCAICFRQQKLVKENNELVMVHHGFHISDGAGRYYGYRAGSCQGVGFQPYELSSEANEAYKKLLGAQLLCQQEFLQKLNKGEITTLQYRVRSTGDITEWKTTSRGDSDWDKIFKKELNEAESNIKQIKSDISWQDDLIARWTPQSVVFDGTTYQASRG
jgi:hypothetical protein